MKNSPYSESSAGFTLIEVMVGLLISMALLGGLMMNFLSQSNEYKYQDKRADAVQDLEFTIRYIANDLRAALIQPDATEVNDTMPNRSINFSGAGIVSSQFLSFTVWDEVNGNAVTKEALRCYRFDSGMLKYGVASAACTAATVLPDAAAILGEVGNGAGGGLKVTQFRIFQDIPASVTAATGVEDLDRAKYTGIPDPLPTKTYIDVNLVRYQVPAFTVLIEIEVDSFENASATDVLNKPVINGKGKLWRYMQVYPAVVINPVVVP